MLDLGIKMNQYAYKIFISLLFVLSLFILKDFILPVLMGAILAIVLNYPIKYINIKLKNHLLSIVLVNSLICFLLIFPLYFLTIKGFSDLLSFVNNIELNSLIENTNKMIFSNYYVSMVNPEDVQNYLKNIGTWGLKQIISAVEFFVFSLPKILIETGISLVSSFLFLLKKDQIKNLFLNNVFFTNKETNKIYSSIVSITNSVILSSLFSGICQSFVMAIVSLIILPEHFILIAFTTFVFSFIPVVGTSPITIGLLLLKWHNQDIQAIVFLIVGITLLFLIDNVLKPILIGNKIKLNPIFAFMAAIGGLSSFGFYGLFLGPIAIGLLVKHIQKE